MYNTRRTSNNSPRYPNQNNRRNQHQRLPQTMPHVATFITPKATNQVQVPFQSQQQPMQGISEHNTPAQPLLQYENQSNLTANDHSAMHEMKDEVQSQNLLQHLPSLSDQLLSKSLPSLDQNPNQTPSTQNQEANDSESHKMITNTKNEDNQSNDDTKTEKSFKFPKRKINKKEQKKRLNARMRRLVCPKSPLMVFSELYKDVPINIDDTLNENGVHYTASFEVDGQLYVGKHQGKTQAKQKACEIFLRQLLEKKMRETANKKEDCADLEKEDSENGTLAKPKGPPQEDFPWPHFASLAMHNLIHHWEIQPTTKILPEEPTVKQIPKAIGGMKKFPQNPENYNPVQLLHQMAPSVRFIDRIISLSNPSLFEVTCDLNEMSFKGQGSTKKTAKKECSIAAIKHFWNFDFHSISVK